MNKLKKIFEKLNKSENKKIQILLLTIFLFVVLFIIYIFISINKTSELIANLNLSEARKTIGYNFISSDKKDVVESCYHMYDWLKFAENIEIKAESNDTYKDLYIDYNISCLKEVIAHSEDNETELFKNTRQNALNECIQNLMNVGCERIEIVIALEDYIEENKDDKEFLDFYPYYSSYGERHTIEELLEKVRSVIYEAEINRDQVKNKTNPYQGLSIRYDKYEDGYIKGKIYNDNSYMDYEDVKIKVTISSEAYFMKQFMGKLMQVNLKLLKLKLTITAI